MNVAKKFVALGRGYAYALVLHFGRLPDLLGTVREKVRRRTN